MSLPQCQQSTDQMLSELHNAFGLLAATILTSALYLFVGGMALGVIACTMTSIDVNFR